MSDLKMNLINKVKNDQFFDELELSRLAQDPTMNFRIKVDDMINLLEKLALNNAKMALIEQYFKEPEQIQEEKRSAPFQGQSHGE